MKIVVDAGHGGSDPGAVGPGGLTEASAAMAISLHVERGLAEAGHIVAQTRVTDAFIPLGDRCALANAYLADLLVSVHCNAFSSGAHGYELWTSRGETASDPIAERLFNSIGEAFPRLTPRFDTTDGDHDKEAGFKVLTGTHCAAVLVECAFISNPLEERWLADVGWRMRMAGAIVTGIGV